jgi:BlaI family transcriptional regulator, penicillinase repressor
MDDLATNSSSSVAAKARPPRRAVLDLAPLELDCMNTLWPMGEGTVREIRDRLAERLPRAYTTIMTIMDRLARKGIVERRKAGRAYIYRANLTAEDARSQALGHVVEKFFGGSKDLLLAHLGNSQTPPAPRAVAASAAAAGGSSFSAAASGSAASSTLPEK